MPRRGMGVEIGQFVIFPCFHDFVMPRRGMGVEISNFFGWLHEEERHAPQGHGSRNYEDHNSEFCNKGHAPQGHGSRNQERINIASDVYNVMPRRGMGVEMTRWPRWMC